MTGVHLTLAFLGFLVLGAIIGAGGIYAWLLSTIE